MPEGKYCKIGGDIKTIVGEYVEIGGVIKNVVTNAIEIGGAIKEISLGDRYVYTSESLNEELYRLTGAGAEDWHYDLTVSDDTVIAVNEDGESYWGVGVNLVKLNADGTLAWTFSRYGVLITSITLENRSGVTYVYFGQFDGGVVCLLDALTAVGEVWAVNVDVTFGPPVYALAVDAANSLIYAGVGVAALSKGVWRAALSTGTFVKIYTSAEDISALAVDMDGRVYSGDSAGNYRKISNAGYVYWTKTLTGSIVTIEIAHNGYGYLSCESEKKVYKFTASTGVAIWNYAPAPATSALAYRIAVDSSGNVYAVYRYLGGNSGNFIYKISKDGAFVWRWQSRVAVKFYGMAVTPGLEASGY